MNSSDTATATHLLEVIMDLHASVGDGLNDDEFTRFLRAETLPTEAGFAFLSYSDRFVTLSVPRQDLAKWSPKQGWVAAEKEVIARQIAAKHELSLSAPPDALHTCLATTNPRHHLELNNRRETILVIHPQYLKVRVYMATDRAHHEWAAQRPLAFGPDLLQDLAALYRG